MLKALACIVLYCVEGLAQRERPGRKGKPSQTVMTVPFLSKFVIMGICLYIPNNWPQQILEHKTFVSWALPTKDALSWIRQVDGYVC